MDIIAQAIGIAAMAFNILSYQMKNQRGIIIMQLFGCALFSVNMFMLGGITGGILNFIAVIRAIIYSNKKFFRADKIIWVYGFVAIYLASYASTFLIFHKEPTAFNFIVEFLPIIGIISTTISFYLSDAKSVRLFALISSPVWLIYNITKVAMGGIICETISIISVFIGMLRHDIKKKA